MGCLCRSKFSQVQNRRGMGRGDVLDDEDPAPASHAESSIQVTNSECQQTTTSTRKSRRDEEITDADGKLTPRVDWHEVSVNLRRDQTVDGQKVR